LSILGRIIKAFRKPTGRGHVPAKILPNVEIRPTSENSDSRKPYADKPAQKLVNSAFEGEDDWPEYRIRIIETSLLAQLESRGIQLNRISVDMLGLTPGVSTALKKANIQTIEQLSNCTAGHLLCMNYIGWSKLEKIKRSLTSFLDEILARSDTTEQARAEAEHKTEQLYQLASNLCKVFEDQGLLDDLQLPFQGQKKLHKATGEKPETLADLKRLIESHSSQISILEWEKQISTINYAMEEAIDWLNKVVCGSIDDEINELVGYLDDRERFLLINRFGMEKHLTLEMIGEQFGITRERVRQIESQMRDKLVNRIARSSLLYSAAGIALLKRLSEDATVDSWKQRLMDIGFLKEEASADLLVAISRVTNSSRLALPEDFDQMLETHVSPHILLARKPVLNKARMFCRNCGAIRIVSLTSEKLSEADVEQILCSDGFTEVSSGWWMRKIGECVPEHVARKVITSCGPVSPSNLHQALIRHLSRRQFPAPPSKVLVETLEQTGRFALVDGFLELTKMPTRKPGLTGPESIFVRLVQSEGPIVSFESIHTKLIEENWSRGSVAALLSLSPIVQKVAFGLYTLLGTQYDIGDVERAKSQLIRVPANASMKPRSDGEIEFETNIGTWMIYGGVLSCGPAASMEGTWTRIVDGVNNGELVVGGGFIRGLSEVVESLDLMPGDRIKIEFNTWTREATITKVVNNEQIC